MAELSRDEVAEVLGRVGDAIAAEIIATGIGKDELRAARDRVARDRKSRTPGPRLKPGAFAQPRIGARPQPQDRPRRRYTEPAQVLVVIPGRAEGANPESIATVRGYGFRLSPLSRLGRNDEPRGLQPRPDRRERAS